MENKDFKLYTEPRENRFGDMEFKKYDDNFNELERKTINIFELIDRVNKLEKEINVIKKRYEKTSLIINILLIVNICVGTIGIIGSIDITIT